MLKKVFLDKRAFWLAFIVFFLTGRLCSVYLAKRRKENQSKRKK